MAAGTETLREFLVQLGFKVDENQQRRFIDVIAVTTLRVAELAVAVEAAAAAVVASVAKMSQGLYSLYFVSQRTHASVRNIEAFTFAVSQLGGSAEGARSSLESLAQHMRTNPGTSSLLQSLGINPNEDTTKILTDFAARTKNLPYYMQYRYAQMLGIDERTLLALRSGKFGEYQQSYLNTLKQADVDPQKAANVAHELGVTLAQLGNTFEALSQKIVQTLGPKVVELLKTLNDWILAHVPQIVDIFTKLYNLLVGLGTWIVTQDWSKVGRELRKWWDEAKKLADELGGIKTVLEVIFAFWVGTKIAAVLNGIAAITAAFRTLGAVLGVAGMATEGGGILGAIAAIAGILGALGLVGPMGGQDQNFSDMKNEEFLRNNHPELFGGGVGSGIGDVSRGEYPGYAAPGGRSGPAATTAKMVAVRDRLAKDLGLSTDAAAGIVSNLSAESGMTAESGDNGTSFGWAQWHGERMQRFLAWCSKYGLDPKSDEANYGFLVYELRTFYPTLLAQLRNGKITAKEAAYMVAKGYENPSTKAGVGDPGYIHHVAAAGTLARASSDMGANASLAVGPTPPGPQFGGYDPTAIGARGLMMNQNTNINVYGNNDPHATARSVSNAQGEVNNGLVRNLRGAVR